MGLAMTLAGCSSSANPDEARQPLDEKRQDRRCAEPVEFYRPDGGVINSRQIAEDVAVPMLRAAYPGDKHLQPLNADLRDGIWHVYGTLPAGSAGGVAEIYLCQSNGRVLKIIHGQ